MKKSKLWAICNLVMTILVIGLFVFACTYEVTAFEAHVKKLQEQGQDFAGLGAIGLVVIIVLSGIIYAVAAVLLSVSWIGLFGSEKTPFLIVGAVGKIVTIGGMFFMGAASVSVFARVLYGLVSLAYLVGGILDILYRRKIEE